jgi:hypothetical protein
MHEQSGKAMHAAGEARNGYGDDALKYLSEEQQKDS